MRDYRVLLLHFNAHLIVCFYVPYLIKNTDRTDMPKTMVISECNFRHIPQERKVEKNESILYRLIRKGHAQNHELEGKAGMRQRMRL